MSARAHPELSCIVVKFEFLSDFLYFVVHLLFSLLLNLCGFLQRSDLTRIYTNLSRLNEDMASAYTIRQQNFAEMQKNLNAVNSVLKSSIRLRGKCKYISTHSIQISGSLYFAYVHNLLAVAVPLCVYHHYYI